MSIADTAAGGSVTVNAAALAAGATLSLSGSAAETVNNLVGNVAATGLSGALNVTTGAATALSIATGTGSSTINASAMTSGETVTLTGTHAATVLVGGNLAAASDTGALTVTATGTTSHSITTGSGKDSITATHGGDTIEPGGAGTTIDVSGHSAADTFVYAATSDSPNNGGGRNTITGFIAGAGGDLLDLHLLNPNLSIQGQLLPGNTVAADSIAWLYSGGNAMIYVNDTTGSLKTNSTKLMEITLNGVSSGMIGANFHT
jgi:hypothetical protein